MPNGQFQFFVESAFRVTNWLDTAGACHDWQDWFLQREIPVAIVSRPETPRFSLWRLGQETIVWKANEPTAKSSWYEGYEIVIASSGFLSALPESVVEYAR